MTAEQLRNSILQEAISGRLVPQDPNDEPASVLLAHIREEKDSLNKEKKLKKEKPSAPITEDEIPFEIPASWEWVRFFTVYSLETNLVSPQAYLNYLHIAPDNIEKKSGKLLQCKTVKGDNVKSNNHLFSKGQIIYSKIRPLLRKAVVAPFDGLCSADMYPLSTSMYVNYALLYLLSDVFNNQVSAICSSRVKMPKINQDELSTIIVPLPPLAEQQRIVAKLEELLPIVEQYGKAQTELDQLNAALPVRLRQSVLQQAIQGKLVPQDSTEGTAEELLQRIEAEKAQLIARKLLKKEKPLLSIEEDEIPYELPKGWAWTRMGDCCVRIFSGRSPKYSQTPTKHKILGQQANQWNKIDLRYIKYGIEEYAKNIEQYQYLQDGDVLLNTLGNGTLGRCGIFENIEGNYLTDGHLFVFRTIEKCTAKFILAYLTLNYTEINRGADGSTNQTFLNLTKVSNYLIALPPLAEQQRIVAKIEELFEQIDKISK